MTRDEDSPRLDALAPPPGWEAGVARGVEAAIRERASEGFLDALARSGRWLLPIAAAVVLVLWIANAAKQRSMRARSSGG